MSDLPVSRLLAFARELQLAATFSELLETTRAELAATTGYAHAWLFVADDEDSGEVRIIDSAGAQREAILEHAPTIRVYDDALLREVWQSDEPVVVLDARVDPRTDKRLVEALGTRTLVTLPLRLLDKPFAIFGTGTFAAEGCREPTPEELAYLVGMASQLAGAAGRIRFLEERRRSVEDLQKAAARMQLLAETSHQFASSLDLQELAEAVARRMSEVVGDVCGVRLVERDGDRLDTTVTATYHSDPRVAAAMRALAASAPIKVGEGIAGRVLLAGEPLLVPRVTPEALRAGVPPAYRAVIEEAALASLLAVPLVVRGQVIGLIFMGRSAAHPPYAIDDQRLAQDIADRAALAMENARRTTELRRANEALRQSEARFRRLTESGIIGILRSNWSGTIHDANDAFLAMLGYTREDFVAGKVTGETVNTPAKARTDTGPMAALAQRGMAGPWEKELARKDGTIVPALVGAARVDESSQEIIAFVLDLTERRRAEAAVRESEARKTAVMEAALDAIVLMDAEGRIIDFNEAAERTFGYSRREVLGQSLAEMLIPGALRLEHAAGLRRFLETGESRVLGRRLELSALRKDGSEFPAEVAVVRIRSEGAPVFTGHIRDISERRQAAEAELLRREKDAAEAANRELEAFSYSVAHDLRAPLRGINGFSAALLEDYGHTLDDGAKALLRRVTSSTERMGHIIDALLSLARLSRFEVRHEIVDLTSAAQAVIEHLRAAEPERSVEFVVPDGVVARGDPHLLRVVLENLLGNAWKFTRKRADARIEFGRAPSPEGVRYFVRDNGAGFDMAFSDKLFAPFQRLHSPSQFEGDGVGLATVQRIVRRHGGRVWAEGKEDAGAVFHFTLPGDPPRISGMWPRPLR